jgi:hypothetical protein
VVESAVWGSDLVGRFSAFSVSDDHSVVGPIKGFSVSRIGAVSPSTAESECDQNEKVQHQAYKDDCPSLPQHVIKISK